MKENKIKVIFGQKTEIGYFSLYKENEMFFIEFNDSEDCITIKNHKLYGPYNEDTILNFLFRIFINKVNFDKKITDTFLEFSRCIDEMISNKMPDPDK